MNSVSTATEAIVSTLAFFALFSRPLNQEEILVLVYGKKNSFLKEDILLLLSQESIYWSQREGYFYLTSVDYPRSPKEMLRVSDAFLQKSQKYLPLLRHIPYVRFVGIANTVAFGSAKEESDIDLFIVTKPNNAWIARFLVTVFLHLLGVRRHGDRATGRFCLSFFVDESALDLNKIALQPDDIYLTYWLATLTPVWNTDVYQTLLLQNKKGLLRDLPFWKEKSPMTTVEASSIQKTVESILRFPLFQWGGQLLIHLQKQKMRYFPVSQSEYSSVIVNDHMLKFHNNDRRSRYAAAWHQTFQSIFPQS